MREGRGLELLSAQRRGASPQALGNSLSAAGSLMLALLQLLPLSWLSAVCRLCGINKPSSCPELVVF